MTAAVSRFFNTIPNFHLDFPQVNEKDQLSGPFMWWFHCRGSYSLANLEPKQARLVVQPIDSIEILYGDLYDKVTHGLASGKVSDWSLEYLVRPRAVLVCQTDDALLGCLAMKTILSVNEQEDRVSLSVRTRSIIFDGKFRTKFQEHTIDIPKDEEVDITSLDIFPLEYAESGMQGRLALRGSNFWKCRKQRFVACHEHSTVSRIRGRLW